MHANNIIQSYSELFRERIPIASDPTFLFTAYQALYRMFDAYNKLFCVLHASAAITLNGNAVIFGDDGENSKGKTICSLILAISSGKYIADEYILFEKNTDLIYGNGDIPINLKEGTYECLTKNYKIILQNKRVALANDHFVVVRKVKPNFIVIPYLGAEQTRVDIPSKEEAVKLYKSTVFGHNIKFNHPETDVISLIKKNKDQTPEKVADFLDEYEDIAPALPIIKVYLREPMDIVKIVSDIETT